MKITNNESDNFFDKNISKNSIVDICSHILENIIKFTYHKGKINFINN